MRSTFILIIAFVLGTLTMNAKIATAQEEESYEGPPLMLGDTCNTIPESGPEVCRGRFGHVYIINEQGVRFLFEGPCVADYGPNGGLICVTLVPK